MKKIFAPLLLCAFAFAAVALSTNRPGTVSGGSGSPNTNAPGTVTPPSSFPTTGTAYYPLSNPSNYTTLTGVSNVFGLTSTPGLTQAVVSATSSANVQDSSSRDEYGFWFTPTTNLLVYSLGRYVPAGNSNSHYLTIRRVSDCLQICKVTLQTTNATTNSFNYVTLPAPVQLLASNTYFMGGQERYLDDYFRQVTPTTVQSAIGPIIGAWHDSSGCQYSSGWSNQAFQVSFKYVPGPVVFGLDVDPSGSNAFLLASTTLAKDLRAQSITASFDGGSNYVGPDVSRLMPDGPFLGVDNWLEFWSLSNGEPGQVIAMECVQRMKTNGLFAAGWKWVQLSDGWAEAPRSNATAHLTWNTNKFPNGLPWLINYCHTNGFKVALYLGWHSDDLSVYPNRSTIRQCYQDITDIKNWGADSVQIDTALAGWPDRPTRWEIKQYMRVASEAAWTSGEYTFQTNRGLVLGTGVNPGAYNTNILIPFEFASELNYILSVDGISAGTPNTDMNEVGALRCWINQIMICGLAHNWYPSPGHGFHFGGLAGNGFNYDTNILRCYMEGRAMIGAGGTINHELMTSPSVYLPYLTNQNFMGLLRDPAAKCGSIVYSNNLQEIFTRKIGTSGQTNLIMFANCRTNGSVALTITAAQIGIPSNTVYIVSDPWSGYDVDTFTNSYTYTCANTNTALFMLRPFVNPIAVSFNAANLYGFTRFSIASPTPSPFSSSDGVFVGGNALGVFELFVPSWVTNCTFSFKIHSVAACAWTNSVGGWYINNVSQYTPTRADYFFGTTVAGACSNVSYSVSWPATNASKFIRFETGVATNTANHTLIGLIELIYR